jgi:ATP/ADP translocase
MEDSQEIPLYLFYTFGNPTTAQLLWSTFFVKEMMYIPTSKDVKFKAKGFIDALVIL